jgi:2-polyprenyl-3-methyl-5-hydroxy-6-metoxy-1,4-benzoquinol methylase
MFRKIKQAIDYLRFVKSGDYDPSKYWESRHAKHSDDRAVANELEPEKHRYDEQRKQFLNFLKSEDIGLRGCKCLEFGCGNGFWAETLLSEGASKYHGLDISKTAIERCSAKKLSNASFTCQDVSTEPFETAEKYDVGFSIDVTQHIVDEQKLPKLRWVHTWDWQTLQRLLPGCELIKIERFWDKAILLFRRNESERGQV